MGAVGGQLRENYYTVLRTEKNNKLNIKKIWIKGKLVKLLMVSSFREI